MKKLRILIPLILVLFLISSITLTAKEEIMPLSQVKPGMKGKGYSVFKGTEPSEFDVEIIGTMAMGNKKLIIAKLSGTPQGMDPSFSLEKTGVIAGMSGSPVFINGKNIGAVAYSINRFSLEALAGITPIESMLEIEKDTLTHETIAPSYQVSQIPFLFSSHPENIETLFKKQGLSFKVLPIEALGASPIQALDNQGEVGPGSSIGIMLMEGDIMTVGAIGTLTYIDGNKVYGLGHPIFNTKDVSFPFYLAKILYIAAAQDGSYKLTEGLIGEPLGTITQDCFAGVMGMLGQKAEMIPLKVSFKTKNRSIELNEKIAKFRYDALLAAIGIETAFNKFFNNEFSNSKKDHNRDISLRVHLRILIKGEPEIRTTRYFIVPGAISLAFVGLDVRDFFLKEIYAPLQETRFPFEFEQISLDIEVLEGKKAYNLDKAFLAKEGELLNELSVVKPGENIELSVVLKNADTLEKFLGRLTITVPENVGEGNVEILINDSTSYEPKDPFKKRKIVESLKHPKNLKEFIKTLNEKLDANKLYIQIVYPEEVDNKEENEQKTQEKAAPESEQKEPSWKNWKKVENPDKLPTLKDEKPSEFIKQIIVPFELEGQVDVNKKLNFQIRKPIPKPVGIVKQSLKFKLGLFAKLSGLFTDGRNLGFNVLAGDFSLLEYKGLNFLNFGAGVMLFKDKTNLYLKFSPVKINFWKSWYVETSAALNTEKRFLIGIGLSYKLF